jgi:hypothetical protein
MSARVLVVALMLSSTVAAARGTGRGGGHGGGLRPLGWNPAMRFSDGAPAGQRPKPKERWDTPVDKTPDWTKAPDWEQREVDAQSWDRTHLPL